MAEIIQTNYEQLAQIAQLLQQRAELLEDFQRQFRQKVEQLEADGWRGLGAEAFFEEVNNDFLPRFRRLYQSLQTASQSITQIGDTLQQAEEEASNTFRTIRGDTLSI
ncbi:MAG: WXG100 family type VII secretion target [Anaerolineae bacterium]|jgi:WXG100 family type VII secretion target|nr:WXG100 family type VII secretion target [Anaerolineae bacterium]